MVVIRYVEDLTRVHTFALTFKPVLESSLVLASLLCRTLADLYYGASRAPSFLSSSIYNLFNPKNEYQNTHGVSQGLAE